MTRGLGKWADVFVATGYSLAIGGVFLIIPGLILRGTLPNISFVGCVFLLLLVMISTIV